MTKKESTTDQGTGNLDKMISLAVEMELEDAQAAGALGFQAHALAVCTLPHSKLVGPDGEEIREYHRVNGKAHLAIQAGPQLMPETGLAYGVIPRLLMLYVTSQAKKTGSAEIDLGSSMAEFLGHLGMGTSGGKRGQYKAVNSQVFRLFTSRLTTWTEGDGVVDPMLAWDSFALVQKGSIWWNPLNPTQQTLWKSTITLEQRAFEEITQRAIPVDLRGLRDETIHRSPLALDFFVWLPYRAYTATVSGRSAKVPWWGLMRQFGAGYAQTAMGMRNFRKEARKAIAVVLNYYRRLKVDASGTDYLIILPSPRALSAAENPVK